MAVGPLSVLPDPLVTVLQGLRGLWEGRAQEGSWGQAVPTFLSSRSRGAKPGGVTPKGASGQDVQLGFNSGFTAQGRL